MAEIRYAVTVDSSGAVTSIQKLDDAFKKMQGEAAEGGKQAEKSGSEWTKLFGTFTLASLAADAVRGALRAVKDAVKDTVNAAIDQENADRSLRASLELTGRTVAGNYEHYKRFASAQQAVTTYQDNEIQSTQALLLQLTRLDQEGIDKATKGAMGLASTMGIDLHSATMMVSKAMEGNYQALGRVGIKVDENLSVEEKQASLLEKLGVLYGRATAETETYAGRVEQLKNAWGDAQEELGNALVKNEGVKELIGAVTQIIKDTTPEIKEYAANIASFIAGIAHLVLAALEGIEDIRKKMGGGRSEVTETEKAWDKLGLKLGGFTGVVQQVGAQMIRLGKNSKESQAAAEELGVKLWASFNDVGERATLAALAEGKFGKAGEDALRVVGGETLKVAEKLAEAGAVVDQVGTRTATAAKLSDAAIKQLQERAVALAEDLRQVRLFSEIDVSVAPALKKMETLGDLIGGIYGQLVDAKDPAGDLFDFIENRSTGAAKALTKLDIRKQIQANQKALELWGNSMPVDEVVRLRLEIKALQDQAAAPEWLADWKVTMAGFSMYAQAAISGLNEIFSLAQKNKEIEIENEYKKRLAYINANVTDEGERQKQIQTLEAEYEIKRTSAKRAGAKQQKAVALMGAVVNTAEGVTEALPNLILAAIVGAMGLAQIALIARQPIPLAGGAVFERATPFTTASGQSYVAGEAGREILGSEKAIREILRDELAKAYGPGGRRQGPVVVALNLDGRRLAEALLPDLASLSGRGRLTQDIQAIVRSEQ